MDLLTELKLSRIPLHRKVLASRARMRFLLGLPVSVRKALFNGKSHYCPICGSHLRTYMAFGEIEKSWCPVCGSMKRHRIVWLFLRERTAFFDGAPRRMLHVAPEVALEPRLREVPNLEYVTADLASPNVKVRVDVSGLPFGDGAFDIVYCSHVLEHVPDDRNAMREFARVLKPTGWALFQVPLRDEGPTDEDPSVTGTRARYERFGQHDHVRVYGRDFADRLGDAGFRVEVTRAEAFLDEERLAHVGGVGLREEDFLFHCTL